MSALDETANTTEWRDPSGTLGMARIDVDESWIGTTVGRFQEQTGARIAFISRVGRVILPDVRTVIQQDDQVYAAVLLDNLVNARTLAAGPAPARD